MKCVCGYEKPDHVWVWENNPLQGKWVDPAPEKPKFFSVQIEKGFYFKAKGEHSEWEALVYACPKCGTLKLGSF